MAFECWASWLGDCEGGQSREHYISASLFARRVEARGFSWCRNEYKAIGLKSAVARMLCKKHNQALSPFDAEAAKLKNFLVEEFLEKPQADNAIRVNGQLFERWALKTMINLGFVEALDLQQRSQLLPPPQIVEHLYQGVRRGRGAGLYYVASSVATEKLERGLSWRAVSDGNNPLAIVGMTFMFFGLHFVYMLPERRAEKKIAVWGEVDGINYSAGKITYRPPFIRYASGDGGGTKVIRFDWR